MALKEDGRKCPRKPRFQEGDRVLCFHGPFLYKAECVKVSVKYKKVKYQVRYFGVKGRACVKAEVAEQPCSLQAPDACQPSTSQASDNVVALAVAGAGAGAAEWEDEWLPQSKLLKYSKANRRKLRKLNRAKQGPLAEGTVVGPVTREKASALQRNNDETSGVTVPKVVRRPIIRIAQTDSSDVKPARKRGRPVTRIAETDSSDVKPAPKRGRPVTRIAEADSSDVKPACKRGRPVTQIAEADSSDVKPARKRGRPVTRIAQTDSSDVKPAGRRGRPPGRRRKSLLLRKKKKCKLTYAASSDSDFEPSQDFLTKAAIKVRIPEELKPWLWDDWDMVVKQNQLFHLPAEKNVDSILEDYEQYERTSGNSDQQMQDVREFVGGIKAYFEVMLGSQLLYRFERPQYAEILANLPGVPMSQVYGAPHLLRLLVKMEEMLSYTPLEKHDLALLLQHLHAFLHYLASNFSLLFSPNDYDVTTPEYYRRAFNLI
ncbi:mortality factor 4-like protein 1 [Vombatus ursinus]|uniref:mortality factor 4-like protein 1 n=1 Tax=Vombatus ursinus TaxID=29139 RepID=UPI000FFD9149|nr:mortality factor 4-like protein 1 [Vombatus ursinus]